MEKFKEFVQRINESEKKEERSLKNSLYELKLKQKLDEYGVESTFDLDEYQLEAFNNYSKDLKNQIENDEIVLEGEVKSEKDFKEYAIKVLKKAHGTKFDEKKADEVIDGLIKKVDGDWGEAIGRLTASLG